MHLGPFGCLTELGAKRAELVQKFVPRSRVRIFRNERTRSIPLDPKFMFWSISYNFGALGTVWLTYETRCKTGRTGAKVCAKKSLQKCSQRTHPITPLDPILFRCVSYNFGALGTVWLSYKTRCKTVVMVQKFVPRSRVGIFLQRTHPIHPIGP